MRTPPKSEMDPETREEQVGSASAKTPTMLPI